MNPLRWLDTLDMASFAWGALAGALIALVIATIAFWGCSTTPAERRRARVLRDRQPVWLSDEDYQRAPRAFVVLCRDNCTGRVLVRRRA